MPAPHGDDGPVVRASRTEGEPALAELVDLHFFCGYTLGEVAGLRGVSERTVQRDFRKARLLLQHALLGNEEPPASAPRREAE